MWTFYYPPTYCILRRGYTKGLIVAFMVRTNIETRPDAAIGVGTLGGRIALMFATQNRVPMCASGVQAYRVTGFQGRLPTASRAADACPSDGVGRCL
jgi:hypothetical protein